METITDFFDLYGWEILIVPALAAGFFYWRWRIHAGMQRIAREMGIAYSTGTDELLKGFAKASRPSHAPPSGFRQFFRILSGWRLEGKVNGVPVFARQSAEEEHGKNGVQISLGAPFSPTVGSAFCIARRRNDASGRIGTRIAQLLSRGDELTEVLSGVEAFDRAIAVKAKTPDRIRGLIADPHLRHEIEQALGVQPSITIDQEGVHLLEGRDFNDPEKVRAALNVLSRLSREFHATMRRLRADSP